MPEPSEQDLYHELSQLLDPVGLCDAVAKQTRYGKWCDHTFKHAKAYAAEYTAEGATWGQIEVLLQELGAHCDCEIGFNLCSRLSELEPEGEAEGGEAEE